MRKIIKFRWLIMVLWIAVSVGLFFLAPSLQELVREKGDMSVPEGYPSTEAQEMLEQMSEDSKENTTNAVLVFHDDEKLTENQKDQVAKSVNKLQENGDELGLSNIMSFTEGEELENQLVSEDETTILVPMEVSIKDRSIEDSRQDIYKAVQSNNVDHLLTGQSYIQQDVTINAEEGLKKTEYITVGLILVILFIAFRSIVAPFIPLLTVGISYLAAQGIVSILADTVSFPLSNFTQIFMVAVMFGIGTDYCILLINRFKEEINNHETMADAVIATYKSAGKTIFFAGIAVLVGFSIIGFSTYPLYQSAVSVAVGVAVVLIALPTLVPFFLIVLGKKLFWPFDKNVSHKQSKLWGAAGTFAWTRPLFALLIVLAIAVPSILSYDGEKSFNSLEEIGDEYGSVQAFNWMADSIGPGEAMPATVVLQRDGKINSVQEFQDIEIISQKIAEMDGVKKVRSATRPTGEILEDFTIKSQTNQVGDGVGESSSGIDKIHEGLADAAQQLNDSQPQLQEAENGVTELQEGTQQAKNGLGEMGDALAQIQNGIQSSAQGAETIKDNLQTIQTNLQETIDGNKQLLASYQSLEQGLNPLIQGYQGYSDVLAGALQNLKQTEKQNPQLQADKHFQTAKQQLSAVVNGAEGQPSMSSLNDNLQTVSGGLSEANNGFDKAINGQQRLSDRINELISGIKELQNGLNEAANGQGQIVNRVPDLQEGLAQIYGGQGELKEAFSSMQNQLNKLSSGLDDSTNGLEQVSEGLSSAQNYLKEFPDKKRPTFVNIPKQAVESEEFQQGTEPYLSENKNITTFEVVLEASPYSTEAVNMVDKIAKTVEEAKENTSLADADQAIGGISSTSNDMKNISNEDYTNTVLLILAGLFIVLTILLRSLIMPIYLIGSLVLTYYTSMGISELIFVNGLGYAGFNSAVPFFAFVILIALGIDYSIFLMDRFGEYKDISIKEALLTAMKNMGSVIITAAIILGGTFAAMLPSGVLSLLQIASTVLIGLMLYAFVILPLFMPVMVKLFGKLNWWPFGKKDDKTKK